MLPDNVRSLITQICDNCSASEEDIAEEIMRWLDSLPPAPMTEEIAHGLSLEQYAEERLAAAHQGGEWVPVEDGILTDFYDDGVSPPEVERCASVVIVWDFGTEEPFSVPLHLPPDLRLCRRTSGPEPSP